MSAYHRTTGLVYAGYGHGERLVTQCGPAVAPRPPISLFRSFGLALDLADSMDNELVRLRIQARRLVSSRREIKRGNDRRRGKSQRGKR